MFFEPHDYFRHILAEGLIYSMERGFGLARGVHSERDVEAFISRLPSVVTFCIPTVGRRS